MRDPVEIVNDHTGITSTVPAARVGPLRAGGWRPVDAVEADAAPPKTGAGSGRAAWVAYAETLGVEVADDMSRDDIIDAIG